MFKIEEKTIMASLSSEAYPKFPEYINATSTVDMNKKKYCYICNVEDVWKNHIEDEQHTLKLGYFHLNFFDKPGNSAKCISCLKDIVKADVSKHAVDHELIPWYKPKDEYIKYFCNFITIINDSYYCHLCKQEIKYWYQALFHTNDLRHCLLRSNKINDKDINVQLAPEFYENCVQHRISPINSLWYACNVCQSNFIGDQCVMQHIASTEHIYKLGIATTNISLCEAEAEKNLSDIVHVPNILNNDLSHTCSPRIEKPINDYAEKKFCYICKVEAPWKDHIIEEEHLLKSLYFTDESENSVKCEICSTYITKNIVDQHAEIHQLIPWSEPLNKYFIFFINEIVIVNDLYYCFLCNTIFENWFTAIYHIENKQHKDGFTQGSEIYHLNERDFDDLPEFYKFCVTNFILPRKMKSKEKIPHLVCVLCNCNFCSWKDAKCHVLGRKHVRSIQDITINNLSQTMNRKKANNKKQVKRQIPKSIDVCVEDDVDKILFCYICSDSRKDIIVDDWNEHVKSEEHKLRCTYFDQYFNDECHEDAANCKICSHIVEKTLVCKHAKIHGIMPWIRPNDRNVKYFKNFITISDKSYFCHVCKKTFTRWYEAYLHTESPQHKCLMNDSRDNYNCENINLTSSNRFYTMAVQNNIIPVNFSTVKCTICNCLIDSKQNTYDNNAIKNHIKICRSDAVNLIKSNDTNGGVNSIVSSANASNELNVTYCSSKNEYPERVHPVVESDMEKQLICYICNVEDLWVNHVKDETHLIKLKYFIQNFTDDFGDFVNCNICYEDVRKNKIGEHATRHKIIPWVTPPDESLLYFNNLITFTHNKYYCHVCYEEFKNRCVVLSHLDEPQHQSNMTNNIDEKNIDSTLPQKFYDDCFLHNILPITHDTLMCHACNSKIEGYQTICDHILTQTHTNECGGSATVDVKQLPKDSKIQVLPTIMKKNTSTSVKKSKKLKYVKLLDKPKKCEMKIKLFCYICNVKGIWENHINTEGHLVKLHFFLKNFSDGPEKIKCKTCFEEIDKPDTAEHAIDHELLPWYRPTDEYKKYFNNFITNSGNLHYCCLCNEEFNEWFTAIVHIEEAEHQTHVLNMKVNCNNTVGLSLKFYKDCFFNSILPYSSHELICAICVVKISSYENIYEHISSAGHKNMSNNCKVVVDINFLLLKNRNLNNSNDDNDQENKLISVKNVDKNNFVSLKNYLSPEITDNSRSDVNQASFCYVCNEVNVSHDHNTSEEHQLKLEYFYKHFTNGPNNSLFNCKICSKAINAKNVIDHADQHALIPWHRPKDEFKKYYKNYITQYKEIYYCYLCNLFFEYWYQALSHIEDSEHLALKSKKVTSGNSDLILPNEFYKDCFENTIFPDNTGKLKCLICNERLGKIRNIGNHISNEDHRQKFVNLSRDFLTNINDDNLPDTSKNSSSDSSNNSIDIGEQINCASEIEKVLTDTNCLKNVDSPVQHHKTVNDKLICNVKCTTEQWINDEEHLLRLEYFNSNFTYKSGKYFNCNICLQDIEKNSISKHAVTHKLLPWYRPKNEYMQYFNNFILLIQNRYYCCLLCDEIFKFWYVALSHIESPEHQMLMIDNKIDIDESIIKSLKNQKFYKDCFTHSIYPITESIVSCDNCQTNFGIKNAFEHIHGNRHKANYKHMLNDKNSSKEIKTSDFTNTNVNNNNNYDVDKKYAKHIDHICSEDKNKILTCYCCQVEDEWQKHLKDNEHTIKRGYFREYFLDGYGKTVMCKICSEIILKGDVEYHAIQHKLLPWYRPKDEFIILFNNQIRLRKSKYFCCLCRTNSRYWYEALTHIEGKEHYSRRFNDNSKTDYNLSMSLEFYHDCFLHRIQPRNFTELYCYSCNYLISEYKKVYEHISDHKMQVKLNQLTEVAVSDDEKHRFYLYKSLISDDDLPECADNCGNEIFECDNVDKKKGKSYPTRVNLHIKRDMERELNCYICNVCDIWKDHIYDESHLLYLEYFGENFTDKYNKFVTCNLCNKDIEKCYIHQHASEHQLIPWYRPPNEFKFYFENFITICNDIYYCHVCKQRFNYWHQAITHIKNSEHKKSKNKRLIDGKIMHLELASEMYEKFVRNIIINSDYKCVLCNWKIFSPKSVNEHISCTQHKLKLISVSRDSSLPKINTTANEYLDRSLGNDICEVSNDLKSDNAKSCGDDKKTNKITYSQTLMKLSPHDDKKDGIDANNDDNSPESWEDMISSYTESLRGNSQITDDVIFTASLSNPINKTDITNNNSISTTAMLKLSKAPFQEKFSKSKKSPTQNILAKRLITNSQSQSSITSTQNRDESNLAENILLNLFSFPSSASQAAQNARHNAESSESSAKFNNNAEQDRVRSFIHRSNTHLSREILEPKGIHRTLVHCKICLEKFVGYTRLHEHVTSHFWQHFVDPNSNNDPINQLTINVPYSQSQIHTFEANTPAFSINQANQNQQMMSYNYIQNLIQNQQMMINNYIQNLNQTNRNQSMMFNNYIQNPNQANQNQLMMLNNYIQNLTQTNQNQSTMFNNCIQNSNQINQNQQMMFNNYIQNPNQGNQHQQMINNCIQNPNDRTPIRIQLEELCRLVSQAIIVNKSNSNTGDLPNSSDVRENINSRPIPNTNEKKELSEAQAAGFSGREQGGGTVKLNDADKSPSQKNRLKCEDLSPDKEYTLDIYQIDRDVLMSMKLSITRCAMIDKNNVYCLICRENFSGSLISTFEHFRSIKHNYCLKEMILDDVTFATFPDQVSDLMLAKHTMEDNSDETVRCYACKEDVPNNLDNLHEHMKKELHCVNCALVMLDTKQLIPNLCLLMKCDWYSVQIYWCVPCKTRYKRENRFYDHLTSRKHNDQCAKFVTYEKLIFDYCPTCAVLIYGFLDSSAYHSQCKQHKYFSERSFYIVNKLPTAVENMLDDAENQAEKAVELLKKNIDIRKDKEKIVVEDLLTIIQPFIEVTAHPFGSRVSGLASNSSDLDIFLDCDDRYYRGRNNDNVSEYMNKVEKALKLCDIWSINKTVMNCRIPIIKVIHKPSGIDCDLSFSNGLTIENSMLIKTINEKFPLCQKLVLFVKRWINYSNLSGEDGISSYGIAWMVIYYLQTKAIIPTIIDLIKASGSSQIIGGWETGVDKNFLIPTCSNFNFKNLLKGFFEMYASFDFRNHIICPLLGYPVKKKLFLNPKKCLPAEMYPYKRYTRREKYDPLAIDSPLVVQDPFDLSNNITRAVDKFHVYKFKKYCALSAQK